MADSPIEQLTTTPQNNLTWQPSDEDRALVKKYQPYITTIMDMTPDKKKTVFTSIGLNPDEIKSRPEYKNLQERNRTNEQDMLAARSKVNKITVGAFFASAAAAFGSYSYAAKKSQGSRGIRAIATVLMAFFATVGALFISTKIFTKKPAQDGLQLTQEALAAEMVEIARALDKNGTSAVPGTAAPVLAAPAATAPDTQNAVTGQVKDLTADTPVNDTQAKLVSASVPPLPPSFRERRIIEQQNAAQAGQAVSV